MPKCAKIIILMKQHIKSHVYMASFKRYYQKCLASIKFSVHKTTHIYWNTRVNLWCYKWHD